MTDRLILLAYLWPLLALIAVMIHIVFIHSKRRWPHTRARDRYVHIVTFDSKWFEMQDWIAAGLRDAERHNG